MTTLNLYTPNNRTKIPEAKTEKDWKKKQKLNYIWKLQYASFGNWLNKLAKISKYREELSSAIPLI